MLGAFDFNQATSPRERKLIHKARDCTGLPARSAAAYHDEGHAFRLRD
jgi:hypothetical protein